MANNGRLKRYLIPATAMFSLPLAFVGWQAAADPPASPVMQDAEVRSKVEYSAELTPAAPINNQNQAPASTNSNKSSTKIEVNGQNIPVPENGSVSQTVPTEGGQTRVDISANGNNTNVSTHTNSNSSNSSTHLHLHSNSSSVNQNSVSVQSNTINAP
jgi:hypothetical protein